MDVLADPAGRAITQNRGWHALAVALALFAVTTSVNLQVPLYTVYARNEGYGTGVVTLVFSCYVGGLLPVLIFLGGLSDRIGRKLPILAGLAMALLATLAVIVKPSLGAVAVARLLQGIAVGLSVAAGTAFLSEILPGEDAPQRAAAYVAATTSLGFGSGALFTGVCLFFQRTLTPASYFVFLPLAFLCLLAVSVVPDRLAMTKTSWIRLPHFPQGALRYGFAIALAWAVTGMVIAVMPCQLAHHDLLAWSGLALFLVNGVGALCQPVVRKMDPTRGLLVGLALAPLGYGMLALGVLLGRVWLVLLGAAIAGSACYGFTYLGGLASVTMTTPQQRARAASGYFLFAYLGFSLPVIAAGFLSDWLGDFTALMVFGAVVVLGNLCIGYGLRHPLNQTR